MKIMATKFGYKRDAVRVKAMKVDGNCQPDTRKFSIDPQITTHEVLRSILSKAFELKQEFSISYRVLDDYNQETYLPLLSDWDLDAAFVSAAEPCLCLRIELKLYDEVGEEWDAGSNSFSWITESKIPLRLQGLIMNHVEKTVNMVRGALNFIEDIQPAQEVTCHPPREPLTDCEFRLYLDPIGQLIRPEEFKHAIYLGGVEPSLRKVVWKHLLNVYPTGLSGKQRIDYMKRKSKEYEILKNSWKNLKNDEQLKEDLLYVTGMVKKDVLRTDRQHYFYAGSDDNQNIVSLFNILTTYALNHPSVSYCQGMSDLASPLLVTMGNEAHAYICFCSLMRRLSSNFLIDGIMMTQRFQHLSDGLLYYDPTFYAYLKAHQADDLLFCYRWLLLEMKREFAFDDALCMLEVMWSSLPPANPLDDLPLYEVRFCSNSQFLPPPSPSPRETPYTKVCALRRQTSSGKILMINRSLDESVIARRRLLSSFQGKAKKYSSLDESSLQKDRYNSLKNIPAEGSEPTTSSTTSICSSSSSSDSDSSKSCSTIERGRPNESKVDYKRGCESNSSEVPAPTNKIVKNLNEFLTLERKSSLRKKKFDETSLSKCKKDQTTGDENSNSSPDDSSEYYPMTTSMTQKFREDLENLEKQVFDVNLEDEGSKNNGEEVFVWENPLQEEAGAECATEVAKKSSFDFSECGHKSLNGSVSSSDRYPCNMIKSRDSVTLPGPKDFGGGNPFLMFLCISVLCQHRDPIMKSGMDYNEIAMHFDKMVRKHNVTRVLNQARIMYAAYLKQHKENFLNV